MRAEINKEETFLDWDPSQYSLLDKMQNLVALFSALWHVALEFHEKYERWYNGPLDGLDAEDIQNQVKIGRTGFKHFPTIFIHTG